MKKYKRKTKNFAKFDQARIVKFIDRIIEHRLFKPVALSIVISFLLFNIVAQIDGYLTEVKERSEQKKATTPIKITITKDGKAIDFSEIQVVEKRVSSGDTLLGILTKMDASEEDVFAILNAMRKVYDPREIKVGNRIIVKYKLELDSDEAVDASKSDAGKKVIIDSVEVIPSPDVEVVISRNVKGEYVAKKSKQELKRFVVKYSGIIKNGLFVDGVNAGISPTSMMNMINLYAYDIDFQRDLHDGDKFEMLIESFYTEKGKKVRDGNVLFSSLTLGKRKIESYGHYIGSNFEYFDAQGNSVRKSLLRTPINGARVSSGFGLRRHPILGYSKMHKGVDFAAPMGTPIFAAGSGTITFMGSHGGYGNFVRIKHNAEYETQYGHASKFSKKFHVGSKVKQGDVVAYVGSTGRSTGPHLHFEVVYRGRAINPASVKSVSGLRLSGAELIRFKAARAEIDGYRQHIPNEIKRVN